MSRNWLVALFLSCIAWPTAGAQDFGVKLGLSYSELWEEGNGWPALTSFNAGAFVAVPVRGDWGVLVEANAYRKGFDAEGEIRDERNVRIGSDPEVQADYVSALVAARYRAAWGDDGLAFYALLGPRLDIRIADRALASVEGNREEVDSADLFGPSPTETTVFGAAAGVGVDFRDALSIPLLVELRLNVDATTAWSVRDFDYRFRTFDLRLGYSF